MYDSDIDNGSNIDFSVQVSMSSDSEKSDNNQSVVQSVKTLVAADIVSPSKPTVIACHDVPIVERRITRSSFRESSQVQTGNTLNEQDIRQQGLLGYNFRIKKKK